MKAEQILENSAKKNMVKWSQTDFKKSHSRLYKTIIEAINEALIIDSVINWVAIDDQEPPMHQKVMASDGKEIGFDVWSEHYKDEWNNSPYNFKHWAELPKPPCL